MGGQEGSYNWGVKTQEQTFPGGVEEQREGDNQRLSLTSWGGQNDDGADDADDIRRGRSERLELSQGVLVQRVQRSLRLRNDGLCRLQVLHS